MSDMNTYTASINADALGKSLLRAHAHNGSGSREWERHDLGTALAIFDKLAALMPAVRERLAALQAASEEAYRLADDMAVRG